MSTHEAREHLRQQLRDGGLVEGRDDLADPNGLVTAKLSGTLTPDTRRVVDRLPDEWWRPGNFRRVLGMDVHLCDDDHVKSIDVNGRIVAQGHKQFPYGRWD